MSVPDVLRYAAFSSRSDGGNPAGVVLDAVGLDDDEMQQIATTVDFAETAFVSETNGDGSLSLRYFSPIAEVPFCGHATVAAAIAIADRDGTFLPTSLRFATPVGVVAIDISRDETGLRAAFTSIPPTITALPDEDLDTILRLLGLDRSVLDSELPPRIANAGNPHPLIVLADRDAFDSFQFDPSAIRQLMNDREWPATITLVHRAGHDRFSSRNLFPVGRITEDPATGSAAAALGGYLRALEAVPVPSRIFIEQGAHVGRPGLLTVDIPAVGGIVVSGHAVPIR